MSEQLSVHEPSSILVTGTTGRVGSAIMPALRQRFHTAEFDLRITPDGTTRFQGDIQILGSLALAVMTTRPECIVHLAANADQNASAAEIQGPNIDGVHALYQAASMSDVKKIVYASSLHTLSRYRGFPDRSPFPDGRQFSPRDKTDPGNSYGESKVYGEWLAQEYYKLEGIRTICLRLGDLNSANAPAAGTPYADVWLSHPDAANVFERAIITDPPEPVSVYFAISGNNSIYDIGPTIADLGYTPLGDGGKTGIN